MAIPISNIQEGCCDIAFNSFTVHDGDSLDSVGSTCDKIIECRDTYILVEEKSLLFSFFDKCCKELDKDLETYKYMEEGVTYLEIDEVMTLIHTLSEDVKKRILAENLATLLMTSAKKASNTTQILCTNPDFNSEKTKNMPIFYLYCKSKKPIDRIMSNWLSRDRKNIFIECSALRSKLEDLGCSNLEIS